MANLQRARWRLQMLSTGRGFAGFSRPSVFSKCHRAHFCRKIAAVGGHSTCPPAAHQEINMDLPLIRKTVAAIRYRYFKTRKKHLLLDCKCFIFNLFVLAPEAGLEPATL